MGSTNVGNKPEKSVVCIRMTPDPSDPSSVPGDPLLGGAEPRDRSADRGPQARESRGVSRSTKSGRRITPGARLGIALAVVVVGAVAISQRGSGEDGAQQSNDAVVASGKRVLVSDPANTAIVREIAGGLVEVESIVPPGANGHTYEPVPGDAVKAASADLYIENGMELNTAVTNFVRANYRAGTPEVTLAEVIPKAEVISTDSAEQIAAHGHAHSFNAHFWTDPMYASLYAQRIAEALGLLDPANASTYASRASAFTTRLQAMDTAFKAAIASIPPTSRKLVVYHDSWSYFGRRYGIPVVGAIQPVSFSEPSAEEIRRMIDQIRAEAVPAFFGSEVFPSDVLDAIAAETGAVYYSDLSDEELPGAPGSPEHSYEGMMIENVRLITSALGGNVALLDVLDPVGQSS